MILKVDDVNCCCLVAFYLYFMWYFAKEILLNFKFPFLFLAVEIVPMHAYE
jgi:hypothetical protein